MDPDLLSPQPPASLPSYRNEHLCATKSERRQGSLPPLELPPHQQQAANSGAVAAAGDGADAGAGAGGADAGDGAAVGGAGAGAGAGDGAAVGGAGAGVGGSNTGSDLSGNPDSGGVGAAAVLSAVPAVPSLSDAPPRPYTSTPSFHVHDSGSDLTSAPGSGDVPKATPLHLASTATTATTATLQGAPSPHMSPLAAYASLNAARSGGQATSSSQPGVRTSMSSLAAYALSSSGGAPTASGGAALHPRDVTIDVAGLGVGQTM